MLHIYVTSGTWKSNAIKGWNFVADETKGARLVALESTTTFEELKTTVLEDYSIGCGFNVEFSYLPSGLINNTTSLRVVIDNDRQLNNFVGYIRKQASKHLYVTFTDPVQNLNNGIHNDLNDDTTEDSFDGEDNKYFDDEAEVNKGHIFEVLDDDEDDVRFEKEGDNENKVRLSLVEAVRKKQEFRCKNHLKAHFEILAMKHNFDYKVLKSDTNFWTIRCTEKECNWGARAVNLKGSTYFTINKYVGEHTCAPSSKKKTARSASAKTIGNLILQKYEGVKEGPKPNDIIQLMRTDHGCDISYSLAWESREYAINMVRGIPEKSYGKIPKYLHMLKEANPGTHTSYKTDLDGSFRYMFIAFGQCVRGFYKAIRKVIVLDGTFLKNKYKGTLLVATALDGNSNLYPLAFGVVDSENDLSWEWFLRQLHVVIQDDYHLAFVSDKHFSIEKGLAKVYQRATHGLCIHHLLSNVIRTYHGKGVAGLVATASKVYRLVEFQRLMTDFCKHSPAVGKYLLEVDARKWARCLFVGYRYDIRTNNPAESLNSALRTPREFPVIPLLDSIREMLTRWFYKRRTMAMKHKHPLTIAVEKKIARRIEKGKTFKVYPVDENRLIVRGDRFECLVDLVRRSCTCAKYDLQKIPCRHAIRACLHLGKEVHLFSDDTSKTDFWRTAYEETINPIASPEDEWRVPIDVAQDIVSCPESRRAAGRRRKRRYETVEDKIRSSQQGKKKHKCGRCGIEGHNRATCDMPI